MATIRDVPGHKGKAPSLGIRILGRLAEPERGCLGGRPRTRYYYLKDTHLAICPERASATEAGSGNNGEASSSITSASGLAEITALPSRNRCSPPSIVVRRRGVRAGCPGRFPEASPSRSTARRAAWRSGSLSARSARRASTTSAGSFFCRHNDSDQPFGLGSQGLGLAAGLVARLQRRCVPQADRVVSGAGRQRRAVGAEGQRPDEARVPLQPRHLLAPRQVPQPDGPVAAGRRQARAVGVEGDREDVVGVPAQHLARAAVDLPEADGAVRTARGEPTAVGAEGGRADVPLVAAESGGRLVRLRIQEDRMSSSAFTTASQRPSGL